MAQVFEPNMILSNGEELGEGGKVVITFHLGINTTHTHPYMESTSDGAMHIRQLSQASQHSCSIEEVMLIQTHIQVLWSR